MANFGETLKRERELRKITLREVSEATKIGLRYLEALEANRFDQLPGGLFNKGFIRAYSKFIGLDAEAMVNAYLFDIKSQEHPPPARPRYAGFTIEEPAPPLPEQEASSAPPSKMWKVAGISGAAVLVLSAGIYFLGLRGPSSPPGHSPSPRPHSEKAQILPEPLPGPAETATASSQPPAGEETAASQSPDDAGTAVPSAPGPPEKEPAAAPLREQQASAAPPAEESGAAPRREDRPAEAEMLSLVLSASETTWIAVSCDGTERLNKEIAAGNVVKLSCRNQIRLSTGNAGTITIRINGNDCLPLGERGEVVHDFIFDRDRAAELCAPSFQEP